MYYLQDQGDEFNALMMVAVHTSAPSVDIELRTRQYIPEDSELHTRRRENLKSHKSRMITKAQRMSTSCAIILSKLEVTF
jgi:hypothetical protein